MSDITFGGIGARHSRAAGHESAVDLRNINISLVSTYPPTRCGLGRFAHSLRQAWAEVAPNARVEVARIAAEADPGVSHPDVAVLFDPASEAACRVAAERINRAEVAVIQHEFGIYGPNDGEAVLALLSGIRIPVVSVLHTVLDRPSRRQMGIVGALASSGPVIVPTEGARHRLIDLYEASPSAVSVIPHGSWWSPAEVPAGPRRKAITWGLLGPGKGIERCLRSLAKLRLVPEATLQIVGQTHPKVLATSGQAYRRYLEDLVTELGLDERVTFIDRYVDDAELKALAEAAHVVVIPYDNHDQICSGVLTEAVALGRPVVATAFPHAQELLAVGAGVVVPHTERGIIKGLRLMMEDDLAFAFAAGQAAALSRSLSWPDVASRYLEILHVLRRKVSVA